jgi:anti-sigma B factor antagonist
MAAATVNREVSILEFSIKTAELGGDAFVVTLSGEADLHTASQLEQALQGVLALGGTAVAVDLGDVSFIDSTALGVLIRHQPRFNSRGGELVIVTQDRRVLRTFEITGLDRVFAIERRLADGVASIQRK